MPAPICAVSSVVATTRYYPYENTWTIREVGKHVDVCSGGPYHNRTNHTHACCLSPTGIYKLACRDSYGDGWNGGNITIGGATYCGTGHWRQQEHVLTMGPTPVPTPAPPTPPSPVPTPWPTP